MRLTCIASSLPAETRRGIIPLQTSLGGVDTKLASWIAEMHTMRPIIAAPDLDLSEFQFRSVTIEASLKDRNQGDWHGCNLRDLASENLDRWINDPQFAPPGGESGQAMFERTGAWMERITIADNPIVIARPAVIRLLLVHALGGGTAMMSRLDVPPSSRSEISAYRGWRVSVIGVDIA